MSPSLAVVADAREQGLAAPPAHVAQTVRPGTPTSADAVVLLGDWDSVDGGVHVRWCDEAPRGPSQERERRIGTAAGANLWRRAPWPAADALFELAAPEEGAGVVVAGGGGRREALVEAIGARGLPVREESRLGADALKHAFAVVLLPAEGAEGTLPLEAVAVLAARRLLLVPPTETAFGLMAGIDHLQFTLAPEAADLVESARNHPRAYASLRAWGAFAARRHRASEVYSALLTDLELEGALAGG